jgi:hypothetical protein
MIEAQRTRHFQLSFSRTVDVVFTLLNVPPRHATKYNLQVNITPRSELAICRTANGISHYPSCRYRLRRLGVPAESTSAAGTSAVCQHSFGEDSGVDLLLDLKNP